MKRAIGIDIGEKSIKVVQVCATSGRLQLEHYAIKELNIPADISIDKKIQTIAKTLKEIFKEYSFKTDNLITSIPDSFVNLKVVQFPVMEIKALKNAINFGGLDENLPYDIKAMPWDVQILPSSEITIEQKQQKMDVLLAAVRSNAVEYCFSIFKSFGHIPDIIDVSSLASINYFVFTSKSLEGSTGLLNIGITRSSLTIIHRGKFRFSLNLPFSSDNIEGCISHIKRALQYYKDKENKKIEKLIINGESPKLKDISKLLQEQIECEIHIQNSFDKILIGKNQTKEQVMEDLPVIEQALGLGIKGLTEVTYNINLIPEKVIKKEKNIRNQKRILAVAACILIVLGSICGVSIKKWIKLNKEFKTGQIELSSLKENNKELYQKYQILLEYEKFKEYIKQNTESIDYKLALEDLIRTTPSVLKFEKLEIKDNGSINIDGWTNSSEGDRIHDFTKESEKLDYFNHLQLAGLTNEGDRIRFQLGRRAEPFKKQ